MKGLRKPIEKEYAAMLRYAPHANLQDLLHMGIGRYWFEGVSFISIGRYWFEGVFFISIGKPAGLAPHGHWQVWVLRCFL